MYAFLNICNKPKGRNMKKSTHSTTKIPLVMVLSAAFLLLHTTGYADGFNTGQIVEETEKIRTFLFGPGAKIIAIFGGAWGIFQSIISGSVKPLLIYGGIGLAANFLPKFIDMVF